MKNRIKLLHKSHFIKPQMHWRILLKLFLTLSILLVGLSLYFQYKISTKEIKAEPESTESPALVNQSALQKVKDSFANKKQEKDKIISGSTLFKDPS